MATEPKFTETDEQRIEAIKIRRAKATQFVTRMMWVVDGDESGCTSGWMPTNKILDGFDYEFTEDTYEALEKQIAEFGGESNYDNDHEFCFHAYSDVSFLLDRVAALEAQVKRGRERDEKLVKAAFDYCYKNRSSVGGFPNSRDVPAIIASVDEAGEGGT